MLFIVLEAVPIIDVAIIVWGILCIILFFKVWIMCNDVRKIRNHLLERQSQIDLGQPSDDGNEEVIGDGTPKFSVNQVVVVKKDESDFLISYIKKEKGVVKYYDSKSQKFYRENEIEDYKEYWEKKKQQVAE